MSFDSFILRTIDTLYDRSMINLQDYGCPDDFGCGNFSGDLMPARIIELHRERYKIVCKHGECSARLSGSFRHETVATEGFPVVGDFVLIRYNDSGESGIAKMLPRKTKFSRSDFSGRDATESACEQVVAANFDYVFVMVSLNRDFNVNRISRYLTAAWQSGGMPVVLLTKSDLLDDFSGEYEAAMEVAQFAPVHVISAHTGFGLENLDEYLRPGKTIVFLGSSGVGKSSLINVLAGKEIMTVSEIREKDDRGRHATTFRQLVMLENGTMVIDTPGMRELGLWNAGDGLEQSFADVEQYFGQCKFNDCRHRTEPGCAVKEAIQNGQLSQDRWENYQRLEIEIRFNEDKAGYLREKEQWHKDIMKQLKQKKETTDYRHEPCSDNFTCQVCGGWIVPEEAGSQHRNHCPQCLSSIHADKKAGDRKSLCKGIMDPIGVWVRKDGEWAVIHRCRCCGALSSNRIAADDNPMLLMSIAMKPLATPPFPLSQIATGTRQS